MNEAIANIQKNSRPTINCTDIHRTSAGVFKPKSKDDVVAFVKEAKQKKFKLHPVSTGKNWGYGSSTPYENDTWILDLSEMNNILSYDPEMHVVRIQPGVTQEILYKFLARYGHQHLVPTTGAGGSVSLLGNSLERGYGLTPWTDHFLSITSLEAVLPSGEIHRSSFAEMGADRTSDVYKWGIGPYVDGLFSQGDLGIVTEASLLLQPRPENISLFYIPLQNSDEKDLAVSLIKQLLQNYGSLIGGFNFLNDLRLVSMLTQCPPDQIASGTALTLEQVQALRNRFGITSWTLIGTFYGTAQVAKIFKKDVRNLFKNHKKKALFFDEKKQRRIHKLFENIPYIKKTALYTRWQAVTKSYNLISGKPSNVAHQLTNWRNPAPAQPAEFEKGFNPDLQNAGLIWYAPVICLKPDDLNASESLINSICRKYNFDPLITFTVTNPRYTIATLALVFNRQNPNESNRAHACYQELYSKGKDIGIIPYRYGILHLNAKGSNELGPVYAKIKQALDPEGMLSPGRFKVKSETNYNDQ